MEIQDRIKERRKALGLTLKDVAKALGVTEATVSRYETGEIRNVKLNNFAELARVLKCTPGYLMGWEDTPEGTAASSGSSDDQIVRSVLDNPNIRALVDAAQGVSDDDLKLAYDMLSRLKKGGADS